MTASLRVQVWSNIEQVRRETIEACAKVCAAEGNRLRSVSCYEDRAQTAWECERLIRAAQFTRADKEPTR